MSIICASSLTQSDIRLLGNNLGSKSFHRRRQRRRVLKAVNRSLAVVGERVDRLHSFAALGR
jgi:hypothetical protein